MILEGSIHSSRTGTMKPKFSLLKSGIIPAYRVCPFEQVCPIKKTSECNHRGRNHPVDYHCAVANVLDLVQKES